MNNKLKIAIATLIILSSNSADCGPLKNAVTGNDITWVKRYLTRFPDLVKLEQKSREDKLTSETLLTIAVKNNSIAIVRLLLESKFIHVNNQNFDEMTALMLAAEIGNNEIVELLLRNKANPNIIIGYGKTALMIASEKGFTFIVKMLLSCNAILNIKTVWNKKTALHFAVENEHFFIAKELLDNYANPNVQDEDLNTPLIIATETRNTLIATLLLDCKANPNICNADGITPFMIAYLMKQTDIIKLFQSHNANENISNQYSKEVLALLKPHRLNSHPKRIKHRKQR
jgi:ankyrin repeat protein